MGGDRTPQGPGEERSWKRHWNRKQRLEDSDRGLSPEKEGKSLREAPGKRVAKSVASDLAPEVQSCFVRE